MCDYCTKDRDGFVAFLPRDGIGNACILGDKIRVSGPHRTTLSIKVNFCPICGRDLRRKHENKNFED